MLITIPGANVDAKDAPFAKPVIDGGPEDALCTVNATVPAAAGYTGSPLYCAVIELVPVCNCEPSTVTDAVAVAPDPDNAARPNCTPPAENATVPEGVDDPVPVTVAVNTVDPDDVSVVVLADTDTDEFAAAGTERPSDHAVIRLYASTEPRPVTWSYPAVV
jgi:hypothetical protein